MLRKSPNMSIQVGIPGVVAVGTDDLGSLLASRRVKGGPFMIVARDRGLALDTGFGVANLTEPILWPAHGFPQQLWLLAGTRRRGEYAIQSVANGLALDARREDGLGRTPVLWERHDEPWQRWRLKESPDGMACQLISVHTGHSLDCPSDAGPRDHPVLWDSHGEMTQQFLLLVPMHSGRS